MRPSDQMNRPGHSLLGVVVKLVLLGVLLAGMVFASQRYLASRLLLEKLPAVEPTAQKAEDARVRAAQDQLTLWQSKADAADLATADATPVESHACLGVDGVSITVQRMPCGDGSGAPATPTDPRAAREAEEAHQREERRLDAENAVAQYSQVYGAAAAVRQAAPAPAGALPAASNTSSGPAPAAAAPTAQARCDAAQRAKAEVLAQAGDPHASTLDADLDAIVAKVCGGP